eukprot:5525150-Amphidinium_carterae.1
MFESQSSPPCFSQCGHMAQGSTIAVFDIESFNMQKDEIKSFLRCLSIVLSTYSAKLGRVHQRHNSGQ